MWLYHELARKTDEAQVVMNSRREGNLKYCRLPRRLCGFVTDDTEL